MEDALKMRITHRLIFLTHGMSAIVDHEDFETLAQHRWRTHRGSGKRRTWYASTFIDGRRVYMHRLVKRGRVVDHANGNGLDNRRGNLRATDHRRNAINHPVRSDSTTGYKGVTRSGHRYIARIVDRQGRRRRLGAFLDPADAARAYDRAAVEIHGQFARLNFASGSK